MGATVDFAPLYAVAALCSAAGLLTAWTVAAITRDGRQKATPKVIGFRQSWAAPGSLWPQLDPYMHQNGYCATAWPGRVACWRQQDHHGPCYLGPRPIPAPQPQRKNIRWH
jgi:hypothetical protein